MKAILAFATPMMNAALLLASVQTPIPKSDATLLRLSPPVNATRTTPCLNSAVGLADLAANHKRINVIDRKATQKNGIAKETI